MRLFRKRKYFLDLLQEGAKTPTSESEISQKKKIKKEKISDSTIFYLGSLGWLATISLGFYSISFMGYPNLFVRNREIL